MDIQLIQINNTVLKYVPRKLTFSLSKTTFSHFLLSPNHQHHPPRSLSGLLAHYWAVWAAHGGNDSADHHPQAPAGELARGWRIHLQDGFPHRPGELMLVLQLRLSAGNLYSLLSGLLPDASWISSHQREIQEEGNKSCQPSEKVGLNLVQVTSIVFYWSNGYKANQSCTAWKIDYTRPLNCVPEL